MNENESKQQILHATVHFLSPFPFYVFISFDISRLIKEYTYI